MSAVAPFAALLLTSAPWRAIEKSGRHGHANDPDVVRKYRNLAIVNTAYGPTLAIETLLVVMGPGL